MKIAGGPASFDLLDMATVLVRGLQQTAKLASFDRPLPEAHCKHHLNFIFESAAFLATCKDPSAGMADAAAAEQLQADLVDEILAAKEAFTCAKVVALAVYRIARDDSQINIAGSLAS
ncbi:hypothetical protein WJX84_001245 [Apatococcus fuscideae]|uniref:Uncharacterized protein n=1 Tax=Apatococcus fuscideae TaxID=2026836 RepID=A0AAW1RMG3_9CHLO